MGSGRTPAPVAWILLMISAAGIRRVMVFSLLEVISTSTRPASRSQAGLSIRICPRARIPRISPFVRALGRARRRQWRSWRRTSEEGADEKTGQA
jgi:hypothetical protein